MTTLVATARVVATPNWTIGGGLCAVLFVASATGAWAGVHLRTKVNRDFRQQVDLAFAGLAELSIEVLGALREHIDMLLPEPGDIFDPYSVIADPSNVEQTARRAVQLLRERRKVHRQFSALLKVCSALKHVTIALSCLILGSTSLYLFMFHERWIWGTCSIFTCSIALSDAALFLRYEVLLTRIEKSIEDADPLTRAG